MKNRRSKIEIVFLTCMILFGGAFSWYQLNINRREIQQEKVKEKRITLDREASRYSESYKLMIPMTEEYIPDHSFLSFLDRYDINKDHILSLGERSLVEVLILNPFRFQEASDKQLTLEIESMEGIEYFPNIKELDISNSNIHQLILREQNGLLRIVANNCEFQEFDISGCTKLERFESRMSTYKTFSLDSNRNVKELYVNDCFLTELNLMYHSKLEQLDCSQNGLEQLLLPSYSSLITLDCSRNHLKKIELTTSRALEELNCSKNQLECLDADKLDSLRYLDCSDNPMTSVNLSKCTSLEELNCSDTLITELFLDQSTKLQKLDCSNTWMEQLDLTHNPELRELTCAHARFSELDVSKLTKLERLSCESNMLLYLVIGENLELRRLNCRENHIQYLDLSGAEHLSRLMADKNHMKQIIFHPRTMLAVNWLDDGVTILYKEYCYHIFK